MSHPFLSTRLANLAILAFSLGSCAPSDEYDTPPPYSPANAGYGFDAGGDNQSIYESEAAYGDGASTNPAPVVNGPAPGLPEDPGADMQVPSAPMVSPSAPAIPSTGPASVHTVVPGDTLSGISNRYGVSMDAIRRANHMTNDTVVLGRKLIIPAR